MPFPGQSPALPEASPSNSYTGILVFLDQGPTLATFRGRRMREGNRKYLPLLDLSHKISTGGEGTHLSSGFYTPHPILYALLACIPGEIHPTANQELMVQL